jgi:glycosyltransferase involved in cell wall biosynthesis
MSATKAKDASYVLSCEPRPKALYVTTIDFSLRFLVFGAMKYLQARGFDVLGISAPGNLIAEVETAGVPTFTVPLTRRVTPLRDLQCLIALVRVFRRERPTIVHTHTPKANLLGQLAARIAMVPLRVCSIHGLYFTPRTKLLKRLSFQLIETISTYFADVVFLSNQADVETATSLRICKPEKIRLLPGGTGVDIAEFKPERLMPSILAQKRLDLGLPPDAFVIGFVGRLVREKGLLELFEAARQISGELPNLRLLIIGPCDVAKPDSVSEATARTYGIADRCVFTGLRTDLPDLYKLMDVFVLPSHREGMPISTMEAQAMGIPVITTDARGARESIIPGETGLRVPVQDPAALAAAIQLLAADETLRERMGVAGRALAEQRFDQGVMFRSFEREYLRLMRSKLPGSAANLVRAIPDGEAEGHLL